MGAKYEKSVVREVKQIIQEILDGTFKYENGSLDFSCTKIRQAYLHTLSAQRSLLYPMRGRNVLTPAAKGAGRALAVSLTADAMTHQPDSVSHSGDPGALRSCFGYQ